MRIIVITLFCTLSSTANAGLSPWNNLPEQKNPIIISKPFDKSHWNLQGVIYERTYNQWLHIKKIKEKMNGGEHFEYDHHAFICYKNKGQYLYVYDSGWGPRYALVSKPIPDVFECDETTIPFSLGNGLSIGMSKKNAEMVLDKKLQETVTDIIYEKVTKETSKNMVCPTWNKVSLKIILNKFQNIEGIYFDDHSEPAGECKAINE